jgi:hypothetical protein
MPNVNVVIQPSSFLVDEGTSVTFSTSGSLAGTPLSGESVVYQWLSSGNGGTNFGNIPSATSTSYTVTALRRLDNFVYRASLSASRVDAIVFSDNATLAIKLSGDPYAAWETVNESGASRVRRLLALGYL